MTLDEFKASKAGAVVAKVLADPVVVAEMTTQPDRRSPIRALNGPLSRTGVKLSHPERQHIGRWMAEIMGRHGYKPRSGDTRDQFAGSGPLSSGAFYDPVEPLASTPADRLARARALLDLIGADIGSSADLIAERRAEARREQAD